jgi:xylulokinase
MKKRLFSHFRHGIGSKRLKRLKKNHHNPNINTITSVDFHIVSLYTYTLQHGSVNYHRGFGRIINSPLFQRVAIKENQMSIYLGLDSSTQSLTGLIIDADEGAVLAVESVNFEKDLPEFENENGVIPATDPLVRHSDPLMWCAALDELFAKLADSGAPLNEIRGISGSGQQHGSVYLGANFAEAVASATPAESLAEIIKPVLTRSTSPIWMDASTSAECAEIATAVGAAKVAKTTGSPPTERFTGPQIRKFHKDAPALYADTAVIHLVSSFLSSILAGKNSPVDYGDGAGMNLLNLNSLDWDDAILAATAPGLRSKLPVSAPSSTVVGNISRYFTEKYGVSPDAACVAWSGDNPNSLIGTGAYAPGTAVISLGTSDTFFAAMERFTTDPAGYGHVFGNPAGGFMSLICFTNGSLAREKVKNALGVEWDEFDALISASKPGNGGNMMLPYFAAENTPLVTTPGVVLSGDSDFENGGGTPATRARAVVESQMLSMRLHSVWIAGDGSFSTIRVTGGGSQSESICQIAADVFQARVERISIPDSAALGAAMRAANAVDGISWSSLREKFSATTSIATPDASTSETYKDALARFAELERKHVASFKF